MEPIILVLVIVLILVSIVWYKQRYSFWEKRGVSGPKPWPVVGNIGENIFNKKTLNQIFTEIYRNYEGYPFVGVFRAETPCLFIRDPEFVQRILVKDFKYFCNNDLLIDKHTDPLFGRHLAVLRDHEWKEIRQMLSPAFTIGKIRNVFSLFDKNGRRLVQYIENHPKANIDGIETRALTKKYTLNNVAKYSFGIDAKCFESEESEFMQLANSLLGTGTIQSVLVMLYQNFPKFFNFFSIKFFRKKTQDGLMKIISEVVQHRKVNNIVNNDYLQFLLQLEETQHFSDVEIAAQASSFIFDGFHSSSVTISFLLLNLAQNQEAQRKLRREIEEFENKNNGAISYETLKEMPYLNACIYESLRLYPIGQPLMKICTQPYEYTSDGEEFKKMTVKLNPGEVVVIPQGIFEKDKKYFPDPEKFMPERMMDKDGNVKLYLFPFGTGPRSCLGQKMGLMQIKLGVFHVIKNFEITISSKLMLPIDYLPLSFFNEVKGGLWLKYKKI